jgi:hypothetical protein
MKAATDKLTDDGVKQFSSAFDTLLAAVAQHTNEASAVKK